MHGVHVVIAEPDMHRHMPLSGYAGIEKVVLLRVSMAFQSSYSVS